ncbi:MAG TPA: FAD-dependent oxidoreductase [Oligoflexia bacterium]|nr:FAD-dependent oxidoreductase [Oligoflexia bacterium]HMP26435.1 FAD-dependent oxidoreductase [Oligoflexia bacterium]
MAKNEPRKIAVVGGGISGIAAAQLLSERHHVTLFEKNHTLGGHTNTRTVSDPKFGEIAIDTGFIVCNPKNYPNFYKLLDSWNVALRNSEMSFGFYCENSSLQYLGPSLSYLLREPKNLANQQFLRMLFERTKFNRKILRELRQETLENIPLKQYLERLKISDFFVDHYLAPLIASIWSAPDTNAEQFPTLTFATFFNNHGMLDINPKLQWQTIVGGSHNYIKAFRKNFVGQIRENAPITGINRSKDKVSLRFKDGLIETFDKVFLATHADEALKILEDSDNEERDLLSKWRYSKNHAVLHSDSNVMPSKRKLWASWNYRRKLGQNKNAPVTITYFMNLLQGLRASENYFVTLNSLENIDEKKIIYETTYEHPVYTPDSVVAQEKLLKRNGFRHTYYCGAHLRYGFHEDGAWSAVQAVNSLKEVV